MTKVIVYFSLGSNLGHREDNIKRAVSLLEERVGRLLRCSSMMETEPWGFQSDNTFINAAACFETTLSPLQLLECTQEIEREMGRTTKSVDGVYHDRIIDIDILLYGSETVNLPNLKIPHPHINEREFVLKPLSEILPE